MGFFFTPHARQRAKERYGLDLSASEMSGILKACEDGAATLISNNQKAGSVYAWKIGTIWVYPIVRNHILVSFKPSDFFLASSGKAHRKEAARHRRHHRRHEEPELNPSTT